MVEKIKKRGRPSRAEIEKRAQNSESKAFGVNGKQFIDKVLDGTAPDGTVFNPTDEQRDLVRRYAAAGISQEKIAFLIQWPDGASITVETLQRAFKRELGEGIIHGEYMLSTGLDTMTASGNATAAMFKLRCKHGWKEPESAPPAPPVIAIKWEK